MNGNSERCLEGINVEGKRELERICQYLERNRKNKKKLYKDMKKLFVGWLMCMFALVSVAQEVEYVDLGLPSGTLWKV